MVGVAFSGKPGKKVAIKCRYILYHNQINICRDPDHYNNGMITRCFTFSPFYAKKGPAIDWSAAGPENFRYDRDYLELRSSL
jgi:hypothetical protein